MPTLSLLLSTLLGCAPPDDLREPRVTILFPSDRDADVTYCPRFQIVVDIENFDIVPLDGRPAASTEGHWHYLLNNAYVTQVYDTFYEIPNEGDDPVGPLDDREHVITAQLNDAEHTPIETANGVVEDSVEIRVADTADCVGIPS